MKDLAKMFVYGGILLIPAIVLIISNSLFFPFITGKNFTFRIIVEIIFAGWIILALGFNVVIYFAYENQWFGLGTYIHEPMAGREAALKFLTGYLLEESLSIDNLFVMALVFARFRVPKKYQHRILFWGILGVLVFRGILIGTGIWLVHYFTWLFYFFGLLLLYSAVKMLKHDENITVAKFAEWCLRLG